MYQTGANLWRGRVRTAFAPVSAALVALLLLTFGLSTPAAAESVVLPAATVEQFEEDLFVLTNEARAKGSWCGSTWYPPVPPLRYDNRLADASRAHAVDTGVRGFYTWPAPAPHTNPDGLTPGDRMTNAGFQWTTSGENMHVWWDSAQGAMFGQVIGGVKYDGFMDSPQHCANIMNPNFTYVGNGYAFVSASTYKHHWVQNFAAPASGMIFAPDAPRISRIDSGDGTLSVHFTAPVSNGGRPIISYLYSVDGGATWTGRNPTSASSPLVIGGLKNGTTYQVRIKALNDAFFTLGASAASNTVAAAPKTIISTPGAPNLAAVTPVDGGAWVAFESGSTGGLALRNYEYSLNGGTSWTAFSPATTTSPAFIGGLKNGTQYQIAVRALNDRGAGPRSAVMAATPYSSAASVFVPINPVRVIDTRTKAGGTPLGAGEARTFSIAHQIASAGGAQNVVPAGATAIAYNLTSPAAASAGSLSVMPGDVQGTPTAAIAWRPGESIANGLTVRVDAQRQIRITNNAAVAGNAVVDVLGYYLPTAQAPAGGRFTPTAPTRVYDSAEDPQGPLAFDTTREINVTKSLSGGTQVIPKSASSISYVVTVVRPASGGHLRVYPGHEAPTLASTINWAEAGDVIANGLSVNISPSGTVKVYGRSAAPVRFLIDVVGYYQPTTGSQFYPVNPASAYDSRAAAPLNGMLPWGQPSRIVSVKDARTTKGAIAAPDVIPERTTAVAYSVTATATETTGHLRVYPADQVLPFSSVLNWPGSDFTRINGGVVGMPADRKLALYSSSTGIHVAVDTTGYFK